MKRWIFLLLLFICAVGWTGLMGMDSRPARVIPAADGSTTTITYFDYDQSAFADVTVYLSVLDGSGQPVLGLAEGDFSVSEDDVAVNVTDFIAAGNQPVTAVMLLDHSGSMDDNRKMADAITAALTFLDNLQDGRDRLGVVAFDSTLTTLGSLRLMNGNIRSDLRSRIRALTADGGTAYYDAVYRAVDMLSGTAGRKVVLALTDGIDQSSSRSMYTVIKYAQDHNVVLYTIGLGADVDRSTLQQMARETGGQYYEEPSSSDLAQLYAELARSLQNEYALTYTSPTPRLDGTTRQVKVTAQLPAGAVTARGSYAVGGTLTPSTNLWPGLGVLPLLVLLLLPGLYDRVRGRGQLAAAEPVLPPPRIPQIPPHTGTALMDELTPIPPTPSPAGDFRVSPHTGTALMDELTSTPPSLSPATCPACGKALRPGAKFCPACGQPASQGASPPVEKDVVREASGSTCANCGAPLRHGAKFCRACGQPVSQNVPPPPGEKDVVREASMSTCANCGAPLRPGAKFCPACGQPVAAAPATLTCPHCGATLQLGAQFCANCGRRV